MIHQSLQCFALPVLFVMKDKLKEEQDVVRGFLLRLSSFLASNVLFQSGENNNMSMNYSLNNVQVTLRTH